MSLSDAAPSAGHAAADLASQLNAMADGGVVDAVADETLGALFAAVVRLYAAKAQASGVASRPYAGNHTFDATEAAIACTALLQAAGVEVFELSLWQQMSSILSRSDSSRDMAS